MSKKNKPIQHTYKHRDVSNKCAVCGLISKAVSKSIKYNQYLCIDCLKDKILTTDN